MNQYVLGGLCMTLGLALGVSMSAPKFGKFALKNDGNYVRLKALHGLCSDYKLEKGAFPASMNELEKWCERHPFDKAIFAGARRLHMGHTQAWKEWKILPATDADPNTPLVSSGALPHTGAENSHEIVIDAGGRIKNIQPPTDS